MLYPFRFKIGDKVRVSEGHYAGQQGTVKALELSEKRTAAVVQLSHPGEGPVRVAEAVLEAA